MLAVRRAAGHEVNLPIHHDFVVRGVRVCLDLQHLEGLQAERELAEMEEIETRWSDGVENLVDPRDHLFCDEELVHWPETLEDVVDPFCVLCSAREACHGDVSGDTVAVTLEEAVHRGRVVGEAACKENEEPIPPAAIQREETRDYTDLGRVSTSCADRTIGLREK